MKNIYNQEILQKAVKKAEKNGYPTPYRMYDPGNVNGIPQTYLPETNTIIFSHYFAKAFWGEGDYVMKPGKRDIAWKYHLQKMVLEKEPIKYIEKFL